MNRSKRIVSGCHSKWPSRADTANRRMSDNEPQKDEGRRTRAPFGSAALHRTAVTGGPRPPAPGEAPSPNSGIGHSLFCGSAVHGETHSTPENVKRQKSPPAKPGSYTGVSASPIRDCCGRQVPSREMGRWQWRMATFERSPKLEGPDLCLSPAPTPVARRRPNGFGAYGTVVRPRTGVRTSAFGLPSCLGVSPFGTRVAGIARLGPETRRRLLWLTVPLALDSFPV